MPQPGMPNGLGMPIPDIGLDAPAPDPKKPIASIIRDIASAIA